MPPSADCYTDPHSDEFDAGGRFSPDPPDPSLTGYAKVDAQYAYYLYRNWTAADSGPFRGARMLLMTVNHAVPFFDDSYAVNSANVGPYGDAITYVRWDTERPLPHSCGGPAPASHWFLAPRSVCASPLLCSALCSCTHGLSPSLPASLCSLPPPLPVANPPPPPAPALPATGSSHTWKSCSGAWAPAGRAPCTAAAPAAGRVSACRYTARVVAGRYCGQLPPDTRRRRRLLRKRLLHSSTAHSTGHAALLPAALSDRLWGLCKVHYPKEYNGAYAACPDPISFHSYTTVDLYEDRNAYYYESDWKSTLRPGARDHYDGQLAGGSVQPYGQTTATVAEMNHRELVLGDKSRSCGQWDAWEAVFGPKGGDGYPARVWDKRTGRVNRTVVDYWEEHSDLLQVPPRLIYYYNYG